MCLAMPMQIVTVDGTIARARAKGIERDVSLFLLQDQRITTGDFVLVHVGYAIRKIDRNDAHRSWGLYDEMQALEADSAHA